MDAEAHRPVVDIADGRGIADGYVAIARAGGASNTAARCAEHVRGRGVQLRVQHVQTDVGVRRDVILRPRTNPPGGPVVVARGDGPRQRATGASTVVLHGAQHVVSEVVVAHGRIAAVG